MDDPIGVEMAKVVHGLMMSILYLVGLQSDRIGFICTAKARCSLGRDYLYE